MVVDLNSKDWKKCCMIIDGMEDIGETDLLCNVIRMLCSNSEENMNLLIGQFEEVLE